MIPLKHILHSSLVAVFCILNANAAILNVPGRYRTIQDAITAADAGDTVLVQPGKYSENINFIGKDITVASLLHITGEQAYIDSTIIDGRHISCVVEFNHGEDEHSLLRGFTLQGGFQNFGGGIDCQSLTNPTLEDLIITGNTAVQIGGGIYCTRESNPAITRVRFTGNLAEDGAGIGLAHWACPTFTDVVICHNRAFNRGGGIYTGHDGGRCELNQVIINNNQAQYGGGVFIESSHGNLYDEVQIYQNSATSAGGGIYCFASNLFIRNSTLNGNSAADGNGGGIAFMYGNELIMQECVISNNTSRIGAGVYAYDTGYPRFERCIINGNRAALAGGGVAVSRHCAPRFIHVSITNNRAGSFGGGLYCAQSVHPVVINSIIWDDRPDEIFFDPDSSADSITIAYSDIMEGEEGILDNDNGIVNWMEGNIDADPLFVDPDEGCFELADDSPCIDAAAVIFIIDGDTLFRYTFDDFFGDGPDMGAWEYGAVGITPPDYSFPIQFELLQPYPNPFNSITNVRFFLNAPTLVNVCIYNIMGRQVAVLTDGMVSSGWHSVKWNHGNASAGVYHINMLVYDREVVRRVVLVS